MQKIIIRTLAIATIGSAAILGGSNSVSAREGTAQSSFVDLKASGAKFAYVRDGRRHGGLRGHHAGRPRAFGGRRFGHTRRGYGRGYGYRRGYGYGRGYGYRRGGAALGGLAAGAVIGGALAAQAAQGREANGPSRADVDYCSQRFKSYDASSGTYLGYDGKRHACP